ncbi:MAG: HAMP domain-containing sensor histidine kinase, partial [Anaerolineae bacterium]|nr:HAMP domain-containing sensor histidine kinase [Anaerolineae bacterium]
MPTNDPRIQELTAALEAERHKREQLQTVIEALKKSQQAYISLVSHELRIPMTAIQGYTDLLIKQIMGPVNDAQLTFLNTIRSNVERMSRLVGDLSDISKIEDGRMKVKPADVALPPVVDAVIALFQSRIEQKRLSVQVSIPENLPSVWC